MISVKFARSISTVNTNISDTRIFVLLERDCFILNGLPLQCTARGDHWQKHSLCRLHPSCLASWLFWRSDEKGIQIKWSRRKLTLVLKAPYGSFLLVMGRLVHAVVHVHNSIWHRSRQQGLPSMSARVSNFAFKKRTELQKVLFLTVSAPVYFTP